MAVAWDNSNWHSGNNERTLPESLNRPGPGLSGWDPRAGDAAGVETSNIPKHVDFARSRTRPGAAAFAREYQHEIGPVEASYSDSLDASKEPPGRTRRVRHYRSAEVLHKPRPSYSSSADRDGNMAEAPQLCSNPQYRPMRKHKSGSLRVALRKIFSRSMETPSPGPQVEVSAPEIPAWQSRSDGNLAEHQNSAPSLPQFNMQNLLGEPILPGAQSTAGAYAEALIDMQRAEPARQPPPRPKRPGLSEHPPELLYDTRLSPPTNAPRDFLMLESSQESDSLEAPRPLTVYEHSYTQDKARRLMGIESASREQRRGKKRRQEPEPVVVVQSAADDTFNLSAHHTAPRKAMELASVLARLSELENRMAKIERTQQRLTLYEQSSNAAAESHGRSSDQSYNSGPYHTPPASQHGSPSQHKAGIYRPTSRPPSPKATTPPTPSITPALTAGPSPRHIPTASLPTPQTSPAHMHRYTTSLPTSLPQPKDVFTTTSPTSHHQLHYFLSTLAGEKSAREALEADVLLLRREVDALRGHLSPHSTAIPVSVLQGAPAPSIYAAVRHARTATQDSAAAVNLTLLSHPRPLRHVAGHIASNSVTAMTSADGPDAGLGSRFSVSTRGDTDGDGDDKDDATAGMAESRRDSSARASAVAERTRMLLQTR